MLLGSPGARPCGRATRPGILLSGCLLPGGSSNKSPQGRGCSAAPPRPPPLFPSQPWAGALGCWLSGTRRHRTMAGGSPTLVEGVPGHLPIPPRPRKTPPPCASPTSPLLGATHGDSVGSGTHAHSDPPQHLFSAQSCPGPEPTSPDRNVSTGGGGGAQVGGQGRRDLAWLQGAPTLGLSPNSHPCSARMLGIHVPGRLYPALPQVGLPGHTA